LLLQALLEKGHAPFSRERPPVEDDTGGRSGGGTADSVPFGKQGERR
jgi:hypothetical protein